MFLMLQPFGQSVIKARQTHIEFYKMYIHSSVHLYHIHIPQTQLKTKLLHTLQYTPLLDNRSYSETSTRTGTIFPSDIFQTYISKITSFHNRLYHVSFPREYKSTLPLTLHNFILRKEKRTRT